MADMIFSSAEGHIDTSNALLQRTTMASAHQCGEVVARAHVGEPVSARA